MDGHGGPATMVAGAVHGGPVIRYSACSNRCHGLITGSVTTRRRHSKKPLRMDLRTILNVLRNHLSETYDTISSI